VTFRLASRSRVGMSYHGSSVCVDFRKDYHGNRGSPWEVTDGILSTRSRVRFFPRGIDDGRNVYGFSEVEWPREEFREFRRATVWRHTRGSAGSNFGVSGPNLKKWSKPENRDFFEFSCFFEFSVLGT
jgi:hypothetical protein